MYWKTLANSEIKLSSSCTLGMLARSRSLKLDLGAEKFCCLDTNSTKGKDSSMPIISKSEAVIGPMTETISTN